MKKFILSFFISCLIILPSFAQYLPQYADPERFYGNEVISISNDIVIRALESDESSILAVIKHTETSLLIKRKDKLKADISDFLLAYSNDCNIALLPVIENHDEWYKVLYSQKDNLSGWVKKSDFIDYFSMPEFINVYGRKKGLYLFRNIPDKYKKMYAQPDDAAKSVDEFSFVKHIQPWLINGDWVLVKATTYDGITKTGWMRWRNNKGALLMFPAFDN